MKRVLAFLFALILLTGCASRQDSPATIPTGTTPEPFYNKLELTEAFLSNIDDNSSLQEMLDAFILCCQAPTKTFADVYVYTVSSYEMDGQSYLHLMVVRQFMVDSYAFCLEIGFGASYLMDDDVKNLHEDLYFEGNWEGFIEYVQSSDAFQILSTREIVSRGYGISSW